MRNIESLISSVGERIASIRTANGQSISDVAMRSDLDENIIEEIEQGKTICTLLDLHQLAVALEVEVNCFFVNRPFEGEHLNKP